MFKSLHISVILIQRTLGEKYHTKFDNRNCVNFVKNVFSKNLYKIDIYICKIFLGLVLLTRMQCKEQSTIFKLWQLTSH